MSKTFLRRLFVLALCACLVLLAVLPAGADFGDYSGDSDYGGSDYDSSWDDDDSWSSSDHDYVSDSDGYGVDDFYIVVFTVGGILLIALIGGARSKKKSTDGATPTPPSSRVSIANKIIAVQNRRSFRSFIAVPPCKECMRAARRIEPGRQISGSGQFFREIHKFEAKFPLNLPRDSYIM